MPGLGASQRLEQQVSRHKFKVGQLVDFSPGRGASGMETSPRQFRVVRLLPAEEGQSQYRIKSVRGDFERVAKENQLSQRSTD
jgi:hypothetical protein